MPRHIDVTDRVSTLAWAAVHIIEAEGLESLTLRKLAAHVRVSPATLLGHLESKERITTLVIHRCSMWLADELEHRCRREGPTALAAGDEVLPLVRAWLALAELSRADDVLGGVVAVHEENLGTLVHTAFRLEPHDVVTGQTMFALVTGLWAARCGREQPMPVEHARTILRHTCSRLGVWCEEAA